MRSVQLASGALALAASAWAQATSTKVCEADTKICFQSHTDSATGITIGVALPENVTAPYDAIVKITSPVANKWVGFAWGGTMVWNPLTVAWANGNTAVASSRFAFGISLPQGYDQAEYTLLKGTKANSTHWTLVAKCSGCTSWTGNDDSLVVLNGTGTTQFAWAQGVSSVQDPTNNASDFNVHQAFGKWTHDLNAARSADFRSWVANNVLSGSAPGASSTAVVSSAPTTIITKASSAASTPSASPAVKIPASCAGVSAPKFSSALASGWKATKVASGLTSPRSIVFDSAGNMLVVQSGKGISIHVMASDGCISSTKMLISQTNLNHGIALSPDSKTLYASSMTQVYAWPYDVAAGTVGTRSTVVTGMYNGGSHLTRTLLVAPQNPKLLVVSHGSNDNFDYPSGNANTGRAIVKTFDLSSVPSGGYNYPSGGWVTGYGMRNEVGITFDGNNQLWGVENSGDNFQRSGRDIHQNNPGEKLHLIGDVTKPNPTNWFGYPTCYTVWQPSDFTDKKFNVGDWFVLSPNNTFNDDTCKTTAVAPKLTFQAHSAPIDLKFDPDYTTLFITFHGSWNRQPTTGFKVVAVPFQKDASGAYTPVPPLSSNTGAQDIFYNPDVTKCQGNGPSYSSGCFRPAGLGFDKSGRLYMTSDISSDAELWVLGKS